MNAESWNRLSKPRQNNFYLNERTGKYKMYQDVIDEMEYGPYINGNNRAPNVAMPLPPRRTGRNRLQPTLTVSEYEELGHGSNPRNNLQAMYRPVYSEGYASGFGGATSPVILSYKLKGPNTSQRRKNELPPMLTVEEYDELGYGSKPREDLQRRYKPVRSQDYASGFGGATSSVILRYELKKP